MYQSRKFPPNVFNTGFEGQQTFLKNWIQCAYWVFCSSQKKVSYDISFLFFCVGAVLTQGMS